MFSMTKQEIGNTTIFHCAGRMTFAHANTLRDLVHRSRYPGKVVLDLGKIAAIDAAGLGRFSNCGTGSATPEPYSS
jgi:anti-anti-sigma regulatory factor